MRAGNSHLRSITIPHPLDMFLSSHDGVIKWKRFPRYWTFVRGIHRSPVNSPHKGQWRGALMFSLMCARTNGWANNRDAGDLRRHCSHYEVTVMKHFRIHHLNNTILPNLQCHRRFSNFNNRKSVGPTLTDVWKIQANTLQWRHNGRDGVSNHQPHYCLLNRLFKAQIKENIKAPRHWPLWGDSRHKWPVTRKMFPFDDVIMIWIPYRFRCRAVTCSSDIV